MEPVYISEKYIPVDNRNIRKLNQDEIELYLKNNKKLKIEFKIKFC
ncbi:hypothetical protein [Clostridium botulinum]